MSVESSFDVIAGQMVAIKKMVSGNQNELQTVKADNDRLNCHLLALNTQIQEMNYVILKNKESISKNDVDMASRKKSTQELKRKNEELEEEIVKKSNRNMALAEKLKKISEKLSITREQTRELDLNEGKIRAEPSNSKPSQKQ